jgi:hypothetical protein
MNTSKSKLRKKKPINFTSLLSFPLLFRLPNFSRPTMLYFDYNTIMVLITVAALSTKIYP